jgi:hypothetical protein
VKIPYFSKLLDGDFVESSVSSSSLSDASPDAFKRIPRYIYSRKITPDVLDTLLPMTQIEEMKSKI